MSRYDAEPHCPTCGHDLSDERLCAECAGGLTGQQVRFCGLRCRNRYNSRVHRERVAAAREGTPA